MFKVWSQHSLKLLIFKLSQGHLQTACTKDVAISKIPVSWCEAAQKEHDKGKVNRRKTYGKKALFSLVFPHLLSRSLPGKATIFISKHECKFAWIIVNICLNETILEHAFWEKMSQNGDLKHLEAASQGAGWQGRRLQGDSTQRWPQTWQSTPASPGSPRNIWSKDE